MEDPSRSSARLEDEPWSGRQNLSAMAKECGLPRSRKSVGKNPLTPAVVVRDRMTGQKNVMSRTSLRKIVVCVAVGMAVSGIGRSQTSSVIPHTASERRDWPVYGGAPENNHYSPLAIINRDNVAKLVMAWRFDTHEEGGLQTSPIIVHGVLYGITPTQRVFALDAATG